MMFRKLRRKLKNRTRRKWKLSTVILTLCGVAVLALGVYCAIFPDVAGDWLHISREPGQPVGDKDFSMPTKPPTPTPILPKPRPTPTLMPRITPEPTPLPFLNYQPRTLYGEEVYKNYILGEEYENSQKVSIITQNYYARSSEDGSPQSGYAERSAQSGSYAYGIYYADDMPYFVEVMQGNSVCAWLYFWGSDIVAATDCRRESENLLTTDEELKGLREEFSELYQTTRSVYYGNNKE